MVKPRKRMNRGEKRHQRPWGAERVRAKGSSGQHPLLFLFLVPKGPDVSSHLSRWCGRWGGGESEAVPPGSHLFPAAGSRSALWGGQCLTVRGIALTPGSLCEVLGLSPRPTFNSSILAAFSAALGPGLKDQAGWGWSLLGQGLTRGGTSFRTTPGTRGFPRSMRGGPFLQRRSVLGETHRWA